MGHCLWACHVVTPVLNKSELYFGIRYHGSTVLSTRNRIWGWSMLPSSTHSTLEQILVTRCDIICITQACRTVTCFGFPISARFFLRFQFNIDFHRALSNVRLKFSIQSFYEISNNIFVESLRKRTRTHQSHWSTLKSFRTFFKNNHILIARLLHA